MMENNTKEWDLIIQPKSLIFDIGFKKIWRYRDLIFLLVRRDFVAIYKQTILGPLWLFLQPVLTTLTYVLIFTKIAKINTGGLPPGLFYLSGIVVWSYFSDCLNKISGTFINNAGMFGKVYFPRLVMPISVVISNIVKFGIQMLLLLIVWLYYYLTTDIVHPNIFMVYLPFLVLILAGLGMASGIIISSLTTKYRDLTFLVGFGLQLLMFVTPIIYPLSIVPEESRWLLLLNPLTPIVEAFRFSFIGTGFFSFGYLLYSLIMMIVLLTIGIIVFNRIEKSFVDTV